MNNIVYMVTREDNTLMEGTYTTVKGVYSTPDKATECIKSMYDIADFEKISDELYKCVYDGELTSYYTVQTIEVDKLPEF